MRITVAYSRVGRTKTPRRQVGRQKRHALTHR
jgi:hypothetical protein